MTTTINDFDKSREAEGIVRFNRDWYLLDVPQAVADDLFQALGSCALAVSMTFKPLPGPHISIAKGEAPCENQQDWGKKFVGDKLKFRYEASGAAIFHHENGRHVWVNCYSPDLCAVREHFGLVTMKTVNPTVYRVLFHITLAKLSPPGVPMLRPQYRLSPRTHIDQGTLMQHV